MRGAFTLPAALVLAGCGLTESDASVIDSGSDAGCAPNDVPQCNDEVDNDDDGTIDVEDPHCTSACAAE